MPYSGSRPSAGMKIPYIDWSAGFTKKMKTAAKKKSTPRKRKGKRYNPSKAFMTNMQKYNKLSKETKFLAGFKYMSGPGDDYLGLIPAVSLGSWGSNAPVGTGISAVVLQGGATLTDSNAAANTALGEDLCWPLRGFSASRGIGTINRVEGNFAKLKSSLLRLNINVDPRPPSTSSDDVRAKMLPRQFRILIVKAKRNNAVVAGAAPVEAGGSSLDASLFSDLFINEVNQEKGLTSLGSVADPFTFPVNRSKYQLIKEERFRLFPTVAGFSGTTTAVTNGQGPSQLNKSQRFKNYYLPVPKNKVKFDFGENDDEVSQITDYNYVFHVVILCKSEGASGAADSRGWNVQCNLTSTILDE